jgi:hypothetical protein
VGVAWSVLGLKVMFWSLEIFVEIDSYCDYFIPGWSNSMGLILDARGSHSFESIAYRKADAANPNWKPNSKSFLMERFF